MRSLYLKHRGSPGKEPGPRFDGSIARTLAFALALAFAVGACDVYGQSGGTGGASGLTISIAAPSDGANVSIPFDVTVESNVPIGPPETGNHHLHLYYDGGTGTGDYDIVYGDAVQVTRELTPGEHTIVVSLRNADHSDAGVSRTITVLVADAGKTRASNPVPAATPAGYRY